MIWDRHLRSRAARRGQAAACLVLAAVLVPDATHAVTRFQRSLFTIIDLKNCTRLEAGGSLCTGLEDFPVYLSQADGRTFMSAGHDAPKTRAATQALDLPSTPFLQGRTRATVEWRFTIKSQRPAPYAMIVRYFTREAGKRGETLVVTRIAGNETCHVAHIDALNNPDAIVTARRIADERAREFDCSRDPILNGS